MQKKIKTRLTLVHERINEAAKKIEETATQQTVEGRDDKAKALESSLKSLKKSLSRIRLCEDGSVVTLH
ncbi:hypothetical protein [Pseudomonas helleri]|uniref:Uncharacterized protein n=1 Tax=Pseudomonas helleri TaxID=1608996 RepID=A0A6A7YP64_9PSED|nr:hypothetical protein [Pseudomonas helleri]MQT32744.1 hypothetical protein [Pseudomonas helleri]MQT45373.1 hypothetical protein [Pseudomonas helleri]MQU06988.1 hypothetical protein [Pseudomonas helleri]